MEMKGPPAPKGEDKVGLIDMRQALKDEAEVLSPRLPAGLLEHLDDCPACLIDALQAWKLRHEAKRGRR